MRYVLKSFGQEICQYIIEINLSEKPFNRLQTNLAYSQNKNQTSNHTFGTELDV